MYRHGIVTRDQIPEGLSIGAPEAPQFAFTLLGDIDLPLRDCDEVAIEMICNAMATGHGLIHRRRTFPDRYHPINAAIVEAAKELLPHVDPLRVYDVAVSNAVSSLEFFETLARQFNPCFFGMDYLDTIVVAGPFGPWRVVFDSMGRPLQIVGKRFVIPLTGRDPWRYPVNRVLRAWLKLSLLPRARRLWEDASGDDPRLRRHDAFHPRARALAEADPRFRLGFGDMYRPIDDRFHVIRAMSVFSNLDAAQVSRAVSALSASLEDGGLFVVGRNPGRHSDQIPTTIFRREGPRLVPVRNLMGGAELREIILSVGLQA